MAWNVGSEDAGSFRKVFQKVIGLKPQDYRKRFAVTPSTHCAAHLGEGLKQSWQSANLEQSVETWALLESRALLVGGLHFVIATAVTVHTLMTKRDVPAAIGWIGMAWLAPILGALLYVGFGINRVKRRARRLKGSIRSVDRLVTRDISSEDPIERLKAATMKPTWISRRPPFISAEITARHSSSVDPSGFSTSAGFPARMQASAREACVSSGDATSTASIFGSAMRLIRRFDDARVAAGLGHASCAIDVLVADDREFGAANARGNRSSMIGAHDACADEAYTDSQSSLPSDHATLAAARFNEKKRAPILRACKPAASRPQAPTGTPGRGGFLSPIPSSRNMLRRASHKGAAMPSRRGSEAPASASPSSAKPPRSCNEHFCQRKSRPRAASTFRDRPRLMMERTTRCGK